MNAYLTVCLFRLPNNRKFVDQGPQNQATQRRWNRASVRKGIAMLFSFPYKTIFYFITTTDVYYLKLT